MREVLFQECSIGTLLIKNRIGMAPMGNMGMVSGDNCFNSRGVEYFARRAAGGAGLLITGCSEVENEIEATALGMTQNPNTHSYRFTLTAAELCERVHAYGTKIFLQLTLGYGRVANPSWIEKPAVAPSEIPNFWRPDTFCRALSTEEVEQLVGKMADGARVAKEAGFDGVEIHAAHEGYLLDQFMIEFFNHRSDKYGGSFEKRMRLPEEILGAVKRACGVEYPVSIRFSLKSFIKDWNKGALPGEEFTERGRDIEEGLRTARALEAMGYDALNTDCGSYEGWYWAHPPGYMPGGLYLPYARMVKETVSIPVLTAGRLDDPDLAERALLEGATDMVLLGRGLLADPEWPKKVRTGDEEAIRPCLGCHDGCMGRVETSRALSCAVNPRCGREGEYRIEATEKPKSILVAGAGLAGMEAARVAAIRGHRVEMYEKSDRAGGHLVEGSVPPFKKEERRLMEWYIRQLHQLGVDIHYNSEVDRTLVERQEPDEIILATGSRERLIPIEGNCASRIIGSSEALVHPELIGEQVLIVGGGLVGCEIALWLQAQGKTVRLIELADQLLASVYIFHANRQMLLDSLILKNVEVETGSTVESFTDGVVKIKNRQTGDIKSFEVDTIITAVGYLPQTKLRDELGSLPIPVTVIGDAGKVANILHAIWEGFEVGGRL